jgi:hypothetical protein
VAFSSCSRHIFHTGARRRTGRRHLPRGTPINATAPWIAPLLLRPALLLCHPVGANIPRRCSAAVKGVIAGRQLRFSITVACRAQGYSHPHHSLPEAVGCRKTRRVATNNATGQSTAAGVEVDVHLHVPIVRPYHRLVHHDSRGTVARTRKNVPLYCIIVEVVFDVFTARAPRAREGFPKFP